MHGLNTKCVPKRPPSAPPKITRKHSKKRDNLTAYLNKGRRSGQICFLWKSSNVRLIFDSVRGEYRPTLADEQLVNELGKWGVGEEAIVPFKKTSKHCSQNTSSTIKRKTRGCKFTKRDDCTAHWNCMHTIIVLPPLRRRRHKNSTQSSIYIGR